MKRFIYILTLCPLFLYPQLSELYIIGEPQPAPSEIVAVRDANGRYCAAIQVISDMEGFTYNSYNGVVRVDDNKGKDMVFIPPDERVIEIYHTGYEPLKVILMEIGIQIKPRQVWIIRVAGEMDLSIMSYPQGAEFYINDAYMGKTPYQGKIRRGSYNFTLKKNLYHDLKQSVDVSGDTTVQYVFDMMPRFGSLVLTSDPSGAEVFLDGSLKGNTKTIVDTILSGEHQLTVRNRPLYRDFRKTITINDGEILRDNIILELTEEGLFSKQQLKWVKRRNWTLIGTGAFALAGLGCKLLADQKYNEYLDAGTTPDAVDLREQVESLDLFTLIAFSASGVCAGWSAYNHIKIPKSNVKVSFSSTVNGMSAHVAF